MDEAWFDWEEIRPTEENLDKKIRRVVESAEVDVVTLRSRQTVKPAKAWLDSLDIMYKSFVRTDSIVDKLKLNYPLFIDDSPDLMKALSRMTSRSGIIYSQPWNRSLQLSRNVSRTECWNEIPRLVKEQLGQRSNET